MYTEILYLNGKCSILESLAYHVSYGKSTYEFRVSTNYDKNYIEFAQYKIKIAPGFSFKVTRSLDEMKFELEEMKDDSGRNINLQLIDGRDYEMLSVSFDDIMKIIGDE